MRCCKLAITLLRGMEEKTWQLLTEKKKRKDPMDITVDEEQSAESKLSPEAQDEKRKLQILNAVEQLSSLIEIKEALCTRKNLFFFFILLFSSFIFFRFLCDYQLIAMKPSSICFVLHGQKR